MPLLHPDAKRIIQGFAVKYKASIPPVIDASTVGKAYRILAKHVHPDKNKNAEEEFLLLTEAYDSLRNPSLSLDIDPEKIAEHIANTVYAKRVLDIINPRIQAVENDPLSYLLKDILLDPFVYPALFMNIAFGDLNNIREIITFLEPTADKPASFLLKGEEIYNSTKSYLDNLLDRSDAHLDVFLESHQDFEAMRSISPPYMLFTIAAVLGREDVLEQLLATLDANAFKEAQNEASKSNTLLPFEEFHEYVKLLKSTPCRDGKTLGETFSPEILTMLDKKGRELSNNPYHIPGDDRPHHFPIPGPPVNTAPTAGESTTGADNDRAHHVPTHRVHHFPIPGPSVNTAPTAGESTTGADKENNHLASKLENTTANISRGLGSNAKNQYGTPPSPPDEAPHDRIPDMSMSDSIDQAREEWINQTPFSKMIIAAMEELASVKTNILDLLPSDWKDVVNRAMSDQPQEKSANNEKKEAKLNAMIALGEALDNEALFAGLKLENATSPINSKDILAARKSQIEDIVSARKEQIVDKILLAISAADAAQGKSPFKSEVSKKLHEALDILGCIDPKRIAEHASAADGAGNKIILKSINARINLLTDRPEKAELFALLAIFRNVAFGNPNNTRKNLTALANSSASSLLMGGMIYEEITTALDQRLQELGKSPSDASVKLDQDFRAM